MEYYAVTRLGRRIKLPRVDTFDGAQQINGGMPEQDERMTLMARAIYGHLLSRVERDMIDVVWEED